MGVGHVIEIVRVGLGEAGNDAQLLDAAEHQDRPHHIEPLHGDEVDPKRHNRRGRLGAERDAIMTDEHLSPSRFSPSSRYKAVTPPRYRALAPAPDRAALARRDP